MAQNIERLEIVDAYGDVVLGFEALRSGFEPKAYSNPRTAFRRMVEREARDYTPDEILYVQAAE